MHNFVSADITINYFGPAESKFMFGIHKKCFGILKRFVNKKKINLFRPFMYVVTYESPGHAKA